MALSTLVLFLSSVVAEGNIPDHYRRYRSLQDQSAKQPTTEDVSRFCFIERREDSTEEKPLCGSFLMYSATGSRFLAPHEMIWQDEEVKAFRHTFPVAEVRASKSLGPGAVRVDSKLKRIKNFGVGNLSKFFAGGVFAAKECKVDWGTFSKTFKVTCDKITSYVYKHVIPRKGSTTLATKAIFFPYSYDLNPPDTGGVRERGLILGGVKLGRDTPLCYITGRLGLVCSEIGTMFPNDKHERPDQVLKPQPVQSAGKILKEDFPDGFYEGTFDHPLRDVSVSYNALDSRVQGMDQDSLIQSYVASGQLRSKQKKQGGLADVVWVPPPELTQPTEERHPADAIALGFYGWFSSPSIRIAKKGEKTKDDLVIIVPTENQMLRRGRILGGLKPEITKPDRQVVFSLQDLGKVCPKDGWGLEFANTLTGIGWSSH